METLGEPITIKKDNGQRRILLVVAWGLPAIQTNIALAARLIDADELLGKKHILILINLFFIEQRCL